MFEITVATSCVHSLRNFVKIGQIFKHEMKKTGVASNSINSYAVHNSLNLQQYICYTTLLNMFRASRCSSSGGPNVSPQPLVSSPSVSSRTVCGWRADCSPLSTSILHGCLQRVTIPEAVVIQLVLLMMSSVLLETC